eukprot:762196-Prorocentrum_minimum.AAC.4
MTSFYGSSCAKNGKDALNTPDDYITYYKTSGGAQRPPSPARSPAAACAPPGSPRACAASLAAPRARAPAPRAPTPRCAGASPPPPDAPGPPRTRAPAAPAERNAPNRIEHVTRGGVRRLHVVMSLSHLELAHPLHPPSETPPKRCRN